MKVLLLACALLLPLSAEAAILDPSVFEAGHYLPPPPAAAATRLELDELHAIAARSTPDQVAAATRDARDEHPDLFNDVLGFDIATLPETDKLLTMVADEEEVDTKAAKTFFHRDRPYTVDTTLKTCEPTKPGKAANSYPSGHSSLAFSMGVVLASLIPAKSQIILARAAQYAENRLICGVHYRSDIVAGQQFGTLLALRLMENPTFQGQMAKAQAELRSHSVAGQ